MSYVKNPLYDNSPLGKYINEELKKISEQFRVNQVENIEFKVWHNEPDKPRAGQAYYADGSDWTGDGSSGEGLYIYKSGGSWVLLG